MTISNDIIKLDFLLPSCPPDWDKTKDAKIHKMISSFVRKPIEPAGHAFMGYVRRAKTNRTLAEDYELAQALLEADGGDGDDFEEEEETPALLRLKPTSWREQDHYLVLGLGKKRFAATDEDIKRAYRKKVLSHHPDKTAHLGGNDNFFKCIQKAWEVLTNPTLRRMFDSCDPTFDEEIPGPKETGDFFEIYGPVFERNARFSKTPNVPLLGGPDSSRADVEAFYAFWFAFESWRSFEMKDEEDTEKAGSRDEKRWLDKKNLNKRKKLKKDDNQRLNRLIEQAISLDPRVAKFKADDKYAREAKKREREANEKSAADEANRVAEEARLAAERAEKELKEQQAKAKMDKDQIKNAIKKERKAIRRLLRDFNNFLPESAPEEHILVHTEKVESIVSSNEVSYLEEVRVLFEKNMTLGFESVAAVIEEEHHYVSG